MENNSSDKNKLDNKEIKLDKNDDLKSENQENTNKKDLKMKKFVKKNISNLMKNILANQLITKSKKKESLKSEDIPEEKKSTQINNQENEDENTNNLKEKNLNQKNKEFSNKIFKPKTIESSQKKEKIHNSQNAQYSNIILKNPNYIFQSVTFNNATIQTPKKNEYKSSYTPKNKINENSNQVNKLPKKNKILNSTTKYRIITKQEYEILIKNPDAKIVEEEPNFDYKNRSKTRDLKKDLIKQNNIFNKRQTVVKSGFNAYNTRNVSKSQIGQKRFINSTQTSRKFIQTPVLKNSSSYLKFNNDQKKVFYNNNVIRTTNNPIYSKYGSKNIVVNDGSKIYQHSIVM